LHTLAAPGVWLFTLVSLVAALLPDVVTRVLRKHWTTIEREAQIAKRNAERKAKRGSYELRGLQNLGYTEHRDEMVVGRKMKRSSISFDETPDIVHPVVTVT